MTASVLETDAERLAECFTARQLAEMLAARNTGFIRWRERAFRAEGVLRQIMAGWFTEEGAKEEARRAIDARVAEIVLTNQRGSSDDR